MVRLVLLGVLVVLAIASPAISHPQPFSYVDVRLDGRAMAISLAVHVLDLAHDLKVEDAGTLLTPPVIRERAADIARMFGERLQIAADGVPLSVDWSVAPTILADRQSLQFDVAVTLGTPPATLGIDARMFPYDPKHQTFVNVYERGGLTQAILDATRPHIDYFSGSRQGILAVIRKFLPEGIHHIVIGLDHMLFLVGLLLLGGTIRRHALVVSAFTVAHSITLSLAVLDLVTPPAALIEPLIALSIVFVGIANLMGRRYGDPGARLAVVFGLIHGFGFANVLREMDLPRRALGWSLFAFNLGVEIGQLLVVSMVAGVLAAAASSSPVVARRLTISGSAAIVVAGTVWFVQRVFFAPR